MTLLTFLNLGFLISVMRFGITSLMDISENIFSETLVSLLPQNLNYPYCHVLIGVSMGGFVFAKKYY